MKKLLLLILFSISAYSQEAKQIPVTDSLKDSQPQIEKRIENNVAETLKSHALDVYNQRVLFGSGAPSGTSPLGKLFNRTGNGTLYCSKSDGTWVLCGAGGTGDVTGVSISVDSEIALFSGTSGKTLKRATTTGILKGTSGVIGAASAGVDYETPANKDATGGYAGLTLFKINFKNAANTFTSFLTNANSAARTYTFQNRDGTIADNTDLAGKVSTTRAINTTSPITGGGNLSGDVTVGCPTCSVVVANPTAGIVPYLSAANTYSNTTISYDGANVLFGGNAEFPNLDAFGILTTGADGSVVSSTLANGQLLIGQTGANPQAANLTAGSGISIANGANSITISQSSPILSGTSASIGGAIVGIGCDTGTVTITGATTSMVAVASANTDPGSGIFWKARVTANDTVTVYVCSDVTVTPTSSTYNVRVIP